LKVGLWVGLWVGVEVGVGFGSYRELNFQVVLRNCVVCALVALPAPLVLSYGAIALFLLQEVQVYIS
jgi:hypothetical protein